MDLTWIPNAISELRLLLDDVYQKSQVVWYMLVLSIPLLIGYAIYSLPFRRVEKPLDKRMKKSVKRKRGK